MKNKVRPLANLDDPHVRNKILNPNQRQLLEDTKRIKEKIDQLREGSLLSRFLLFNLINENFPKLKIVLRPPPTCTCVKNRKNLT